MNKNNKKDNKAKTNKENQFLNFGKQKKGNSKNSTIIREENESDEEPRNLNKSNKKKTQSQTISEILSKKNNLKITKIVLDNFKSFEGKHEIGLFLDFSVVLGPNGSGKSNIVDAMCFALGMKTVSLRTKNLKDLIYKKDYEDNESRRTAFVEIYLVKDGEDIVFKRSISTKGSSDYYFNGKKLTPEEYLEKLESFNIPSKARYFILVQGAIDTMLSKKNDLTETIEYLSGSFEYRESYDQLKQEITGLNNDINKLSSEMHNLKDDRNKVKTQIDNEEKYNELIEMLNRLLEKYFLYRLAEMDFNIKLNEDNLNENEHSLKLIQDEKKEIIDFIKYTELEIKKYESQMKQEDNNSEYSLSKKRLDEIKQKLIEIAENIKLYENQIFSKLSMLNQYKADKKKKDEKIKELKKQAVSVEKVVDELKKKINFEVPELGRDQIIEYREISGVVEKESFQLNKDLENIQQQLTENNNKKALVEKNFSKIENEIATLETDLKVNEDKLAKEEDARKRLESEILRLKQTVSNKDNEKLALNSNLENTEKTLQEKLQQLAYYENENQESLKRKKIAELINKNSMVFGFLYELVTPLQKRLELPVKVSLLKYLGFLVVENEETAKVCSEFLKSKEISSDVLVLENIPTKEIDESTRLKLGHLGTLVVDLIDCSKKKGLKNAINYLLKDLVLCTDKKNIPLLKNQGFTSIIAMDGTLYKKGTIIGGVYKALDQYSFNYKASSNEELDKLRKETEGLMKLLTELLKKREDYKELNTLKHQLIEKENQFEMSIKNIKLYQESITRIKTQLQVKKEQLVQLETSITNIEEEIKELSKQSEVFNSQILSIQNRNFRIFMSKHSLNSLRDFEAYSLSQIKKLSEELKQSEEKLVKISSQIQMLEANDELIKKLESQVDEDKEKRRLLEKEKADVDILLQDATKNFEQVSQAKNQQDSKFKNMSEEIKNKQNDLERIDKRLRGLLKNKIEFRHNVTEYIDKKNFFIEDTKINLENYLKELFPNPIISITFNIDLNKFIVANENLNGKNNVVIDFSEIESKTKVLDRTIDSITEKIENIKKKFTAYISEIEKYIKLVSLNETESNKLKDKEDELNQKKKNLSLQVQTLINELEAKKVEFEKVQSKRKSKFESFFTKMSDKLVTVYKELTKPSDSSNPGGSAYIYATNEDEPYIGSICYLPTPPGKRVIYDIDQLSGGEKTIAILSLVIALQTICETPFIILDEIDSYLDPEHELILENLFQRHNKLFQIIIVTHKSNIFRSAQSLIGTYFNKQKYSSIPISVDMTKI
jgi:structural maintenance of chromosome 1